MSAGRSGYGPNLGTLTSTACIAAAFPPIEWSALIWVGLVPWLLGLRRCESAGAAVVQGFWLNFLLGFAGVSWIAYGVPRYLEVPFAVGVAALVLHAAVHQLQLVAFAGVYWWKERCAPPADFFALVSMALLYTGIDWATPKLFQDSFGIALHGDTALRQLAAIGGVPLLTFVVLLVNLGLFSIVYACVTHRAEARQLARDVFVRALWIALPLAGFYAFGAREYTRISDEIDSPERILRVGFVQGNVPEERRRSWAAGDPTAAAESLETYLRATRRLIETKGSPELVIWPETTFPGVFRKPESDAQLELNVAFDRIIANHLPPLVFGAYDREDRRDRRVLRNALYFVAPVPGQARAELSPMQVYHQSNLFPIGEYFPFLDERQVRNWLPHSAHMQPGEGPRVIELSLRNGATVRVGPAICYEGLFASHAARLAAMGAELLVNVSNDSWFGDSGAARLHLISAEFRSIETGLPQMRVTNTGYSALILPNGDLLHSTDFGVEASGTVDVPLGADAPSVRTRWGDWFGPTCLILGAISLFRRRPPPAI